MKFCLITVFADGPRVLAIYARQDARTVMGLYRSTKVRLVAIQYHHKVCSGFLADLRNVEWS